jgi:hypothetical protein
MLWTLPVSLSPLCRDYFLERKVRRAKLQSLRNKIKKRVGSVASMPAPPPARRWCPAWLPLRLATHEGRGGAGHRQPDVRYDRGGAPPGPTRGNKRGRAPPTRFESGAGRGAAVASRQAWQGATGPTWGTGGKERRRRGRGGEGRRRREATSGAGCCRPNAK